MTKTKINVPLIAHIFDGRFAIKPFEEIPLETPDEARGIIEMFFDDNFRRPDLDVIEVRVLDASVQLLCEDRDTALSLTRPSDPTLREALNTALAVHIGSVHPVDENEQIFVLKPKAREDTSQAA